MLVDKSWVYQITILSVFFGIVLGVALGVLIGSHYGFSLGVKDTEGKALPLARAELNKEMETACANWFTDKRSKGLPEGRIVVCKAPQFLSALK
jgi:hypothetical protein